jgi:hypothetical protein
MVSPAESNRVSQTVQIVQHDLQTVASNVHWFNMTSVSKEQGFVPETQPIMCDFEVVKHEKNPARFYITLVLEMEDSRKTGYVLSFSISTVTEFEFRQAAVPTTLPEDEGKRWHLFYTGLSAAIGAARGYLTNYLAPTAYRGYLLPLLDVETLINRKYVRPSLPTVPSTSPSEKPPLKPKKGKE